MMKLVVLALVLAVAGVSASASSSSTDAVIPVEAQDVEELALDAEVDHALHAHSETVEAQDAEMLQFDHDTTPSNAIEASEDFAALDAEMGANVDLDSNVDAAAPAASEADAAMDAAVDSVVAAEGLDEEVSAEDAAEAEAEMEAEAEDVALLSEGESLSVAVSDDSEAVEESVSAAVDADADASFLQVADASFLQVADEEADEEADEAEDESEDESEDEEESEEESDEEADEEDASFIIIEADVEEAAEGPRMSSAAIELVEDAHAEAEAVAAAGSLSSAVVAEEDTAAESEGGSEADAVMEGAAVEMVAVEDFDTAKLAAAEEERVNPNRGPVTAGLQDATVEETARADADKVKPEVISVISDADVRAAAGAAFVETDAAAADAATAEEQRKLDLMHELLVQLRTEQGRSADEEMTPEDMDAIEAKMAVMMEVDAVADADTEAKADTAAAAAVAADATATAAAASKAEHPRDHVIPAHIAPTVEAATAGKKLIAATVIDPRVKPEAPKPKYRWDIQYRKDNRKFMPSNNVELTDKPNPLHRRDPTARSTLRNPVTPKVWAPKPHSHKPKYRYDVQYEKRSQCCRARQACCIRGVKTTVIGAEKPKAKTVPAKVEDKKKPAPKKVAKQTQTPVKRYRWDVEYEQQRSACCSSKKACCRPPLQMYRPDVQYENNGDDDWIVVARIEAEGPTFGGAVAFDADEFAILQRIQARQRLLHQLLLTHDSPFYDDDVHVATASDAHIVQFHEPVAASNPRGYGPDGDLTLSEFQELQDWLRRLPVVPHLSVVELSADAHAASASEEEEESDEEDASFLQTGAKALLPTKVLKGFVDVEQEPHTLSALIASLPPTPASASVSAEEAEEAEMAEAEAEMEADEEADI